MLIHLPCLLIYLFIYFSCTYILILVELLRLTSEYKEKLCKQAKEKSEETKAKIRRVRNNAVSDSKKVTGLSKDVVFKYEKEVRGQRERERAEGYHQ